MKIFSDCDLTSALSNSYLFLDTTAFITAIAYEETFGKLLANLKSNGCALLTIPSVLFEFSRGSDSVEIFNKRAKYLEGLAEVIPIEKFLDQLTDLMVVFQKIGGQMSYTDFLLGACLYQFPGSYLLTENHKDFPAPIFNREHVITVCTDKDIRNHALFTLSKEQFSKAAENILKNK